MVTYSYENKLKQKFALLIVADHANQVTKLGDTVEDDATRCYKASLMVRNLKNVKARNAEFKAAKATIEVWAKGWRND